MQYNRFVELGDIGDSETLFACIRAFGEEMGFDFAGVQTIQNLPGGERRCVFLNNPPSGFAEACRVPEDIRRDPVMTRLSTSSLPVVFDQAMYVDDGCGDLWEHQAQFGYKTGIAVSITANGRRQFMVGFDRAAPLPSDDSQLCRMLGDLQLLAVHAVEPALRLLLPPATGPSLTEKQLEVLRWMSAGKTAWETGQIMGITQRGVTAHLASIFQKLDVTSKAQAVSRAMGLGLI